jgi:hypothetical protein
MKKEKGSRIRVREGDVGTATVWSAVSVGFEDGGRGHKPKNAKQSSEMERAIK